MADRPAGHDGGQPQGHESRSRPPAMPTRSRSLYAGSSSEYGYQDHPPAVDSHRAQLTLSGDKGGRPAPLPAGGGHARPACDDLRLFSVYGPWEEPNRLMPTLAERALGGSLPPLIDPRTLARLRRR